MLDLTGKVVLVTGGSRGIGAATVRTLGAAGADVLVHYGRGEAEARSLVAEVGREERATALGADLAQPGAGAALFREALAWRGRVDVLVNNAGIAPTVTVDDPEDTWAGTWAQTLQVNLVVVADLCREAVLHFRTRGGGTIINVASRAAFRGDNPEAMHYAASKGGVIALTRSIARGYARKVILAYAVAPQSWVGGSVRIWVDYDGSTQTLEVRANFTDDQRPPSALLSRTIDLGTALGSQDVFAGFTAATGQLGPRRQQHQQ